MLVPVLLFILGLLLLIKGGDLFVDGAVSAAQKLKVPELLIGATVVSIGTTLPEVMVSGTAAYMGSGSMAYGNAIGSVICNTALIAALTMTLRPSGVDASSLKKPVYFFFTAALFYAAVAYTSGYFSRLVGITLLCLFAVYMFVIVGDALKGRGAKSDLPSGGEEKKEKDLSVFTTVLFIILGAAFIAFGADLLVDNGIIIAQKAGVPESVIALTFVALGTSLPELVTAVTALVKKRSALSVGNIIGANLFNLVLVSGLATTISPFKVPSEKTIFGYPSSLALEIPVMFAVMLIMTVPALKTGKLKRWQGVTLLCIYAAFCAFQLLN